MKTWMVIIVILAVATPCGAQYDNAQSRRGISPQGTVISPEISTPMGKSSAPGSEQMPETHGYVKDQQMGSQAAPEESMESQDGATVSAFGQPPVSGQATPLGTVEPNPNEEGGLSSTFGGTQSGYGSN